MRYPLRHTLPTVAALALIACASGSALLGPDAPQGIDGTVLLGPLCPVESAEDPCPDRPYAATLTLRSAAGRVVTTVHSGDDGRFRVGLEPGDYTLHPASPPGPLPRAGDQAVTVPAGRWVEVTVSYDTGIR